MRLDVFTCVKTFGTQSIEAHQHVLMSDVIAAKVMLSSKAEQEDCVQSHIGELRRVVKEGRKGES